MNSRCCLVSGGLDSYLLYRYIESEYPVIDALYIDIGHPYADKEKKALEKLGLDVVYWDLPILKFMGVTPDNENVAIRGRNTFLVMAAAMVYDEIFVAAVAGESHPLSCDKNVQFFRTMSSALTQTFAKWADEVKVVAPFQDEDLGKFDIVQLALESGVAKEEIVDTSSCLDGDTEKPCGNCVVCARRAGIFRQLGFDEEYEQEPFDSPEGVKYMDKLRDAEKRHDYSHYDEHRIAEFGPLLWRAE